MELYKAVASGNFELVKQLVSNGADIHADNKKAFNIAIVYRHWIS